MAPRLRSLGMEHSSAQRIPTEAEVEITPVVVIEHTLHVEVQRWASPAGRSFRG